MSDALLDDPSGACLGLPVDDETGAGGILTAAQRRRVHRGPLGAVDDPGDRL